ncbi:hypothetical protein [Xanthomonas axonopodis]|uniref:hypothetical protein n=1 Tax=Xanthomonas axonopodis TaxID=53413 RepID=UPI001431B24E|nr:hypothetical protein [Xanthomonas axonopodis]
MTTAAMMRTKMALQIPTWAACPDRPSSAVSNTCRESTHYTGDIHIELTKDVRIRTSDAALTTLTPERIAMNDSGISYIEHRPALIESTSIPD